MVRQGWESLPDQPACCFFSFLPGQTIDNTRVPGVFILQKTVQLIPRVVFKGNLVADIGAVKADEKLSCFVQIEPGDDFFSRSGIGCCGQCNSRHFGKFAMQQIKPEIVSPEVVTPLRNTMGFINGEEADVQFFQKVESALLYESLRCNIQQVKVTLPQGMFDILYLDVVQCRVEKIRLDPQFL